MESSCDLEGALVSSVVPLLLEERGASVDAAATGEEAESHTGSLGAQICIEFSKSVSLGMKKQKGLQKSSTFPTTAAGQEAELGVDTSCRADGVMKDGPAYERSMSLPPTLKPISAMKGSRQKNGMASPTENRRVKWAPDVYDPPVTSVCHSVNSSYRYQRRSKPRKEKNKQKKKHKTRSKKSHHNSIQNSSVLQTPDLGFEEPDGQSSLKVDLGKPEAVIMDYSIGKEAKCGSSFLRESVATMHFSTAEAS